MNASSYPEMKLCKRVDSMWASWRLNSRKYMGKCAVTRRRIGMPRRQVFSCAPVIYTENLPDRVRFREAKAINTWKRLRPQLDCMHGALFELVCHYLQAGSSRSVKSTYDANQWTLVGSTSQYNYINVVVTKYKLPLRLQTT